MTAIPTRTRIDWVDYAKGICIILVVMMHSTLGVEKAAGAVSWVDPFIAWARPFRMPDFFMISGLFLAARIARPWRAYLDTKVVHFAYFYVLWMSLQFLTKGYGIYQDGGAGRLARDYALAFIEPFGSLWFIYMLAVFFVVVKATRGLPPLLIFAAGALLETSHIETGWMLIDEFAARFVYFHVGYWMAPRIFALAEAVSRRGLTAVVAGLFIWGMANALLVNYGFSYMPGVSLAMGLAGACAVVSMGVALAKTHVAGAIRYCGENSIVIYLAFFLFMAMARSLILRAGVLNDLGIVSLLVTAVGVGGPLLLFRAVRDTRLYWLFRRPRWTRLESGKPRIAANSMPRRTPVETFLGT